MVLMYQRNRECFSTWNWARNGLLDVHMNPSFGVNCSTYIDASTLVFIPMVIARFSHSKPLAFLAAFASSEAQYFICGQQEWD